MARRWMFLALVVALAIAGSASVAEFSHAMAQNQRSLAPFVPTPPGCCRSNAHARRCHRR